MAAGREPRGDASPRLSESPALIEEGLKDRSRGRRLAQTKNLETVIVLMFDYPMFAYGPMKMTATKYYKGNDGPPALDGGQTWGVR